MLTPICAMTCFQWLCRLITSGGSSRLLVLITTACSLLPLTHLCQAEQSPAPPDSVSLTPQQLSAAIDRAAEYLVSVCSEDGRFIYIVDLESSTTDTRQYNVLRHAGAVYALAQYCQRSPQPHVKAAMLRAAGFLRERCVQPLASNANLMVVWSEPEITGSDSPRLAKLGGTGLALVALLSVEQVEPGFTSKDDLRKLGRFLVFMQKPDGSFYSRYFPTTGRSDTWQSMYYPGEASLGLLMLHQHAPMDQWWYAATRALQNLARRGAQQQPTLPDQWYLLAMQRWHVLADGRSPDAAERTLMLHAEQLCRDMIAEQQGQLGMPLLDGCFTPEGRTCPSATRLEGLLAALDYLPPAGELAGNVRQAVDRGVPLLVREPGNTRPLYRSRPAFRARCRACGDLCGRTATDASGTH